MHQYPGNFRRSLHIGRTPGVLSLNQGILTTAKKKPVLKPTKSLLAQGVLVLWIFQDVDRSNAPLNREPSL